MMKISAIKRIAKKDLKISIRSGRFWVLIGFSLVFIMVSMWVGVTNYEQVSLAKNEAVQAAREQWINQGDKNPHSAGHFGAVAFKPISPLFMIETGITDYVGEWVYLETHKQNEAEKRPANDRSSVFRFGQLTPSFLLRFLLPLIIILLGYASYASEKENNTLRLLLSQQVSNKEILWGKFWSLFFQTSLLLIPMLIASLLFTVGFKEHGYLTNLFVLFAAYLMYLVIYILVTLGISARSKSSGMSLLLLFSFWIGVTVFLPRVMVLISESIYPTPSSFEMKVQFDEGLDNKYLYGYKGVDNFGKVYKKIEKKLMKEHKVSQADSLEVNPFGFAIEETEEEGQRVYDKTYGSIYAIYNRQYALHKWGALCSPLSAIHFFSTGLSHTDQFSHHYFLKEAENYRRELMKSLNMDIAYNSRKGNYDLKTRSGLDYKRGSDFWKSIPDFKTNMLSLNTIVNNYRIAIISLLIWFFVALAFAVRGALNIKI